MAEHAGEHHDRRDQQHGDEAERDDAGDPEPGTGLRRRDRAGRLGERAPPGRRRRRRGLRDDNLVAESVPLLLGRDQPGPQVVALLLGGGQAAAQPVALAGIDGGQVLARPVALAAGRFELPLQPLALSDLLALDGDGRVIAGRGLGHELGRPRVGGIPLGLERRQPRRDVLRRRRGVPELGELGPVGLGRVRTSDRGVALGHKLVGPRRRSVALGHKFVGTRERRVALRGEAVGAGGRSVALGRKFVGTRERRVALGRKLVGTRERRVALDRRPSARSVSVAARSRSASAVVARVTRPSRSASAASARAAAASRSASSSA